MDFGLRMIDLKTQIQNLKSKIKNLKFFSLRQQHILFVLALFILGILYFKFYYHPPLPSEEIFKEWVIEVVGEVRHPGIYIFKNPPTLKEAIEKAGGFREAAFPDMESSLEIPETGTLLTLVKESDTLIRVKRERMESKKLLVFSIPLDLNRVSVEDLCLIPGIGESLAQQIVADRKRKRTFRSIEELKNVKGLGDKKYQSVKKYFTIRP